MHFENSNFKHKMKGLQIPQNMGKKIIKYTKKFYIHEIAAVDVSKTNLLKNTKKTCKPSNHDINRDWKKKLVTKILKTLKSH